MATTTTEACGGAWAPSSSSTQQCTRCGESRPMPDEPDAPAMRTHEAADAKPEDWSAEWDRQMEAAVAGLGPEWGVRKYKAHETMDGAAFVFELTRKGKTVAWVEDAGVGGGPMVSFGYEPTDRVAVQAARAAWDAEAARLFPGQPAYTAGEMLVEALLQKAGK